MIAINKPLKFRIILLFLSLSFSFLSSLEQCQWQSIYCDQDCPGSWIVLESEPENFRKSQMNVQVAKQRFDFKKKIMSGEDLEIIGKSVWIRAKQTECEYESSARSWILQGPVLAQIHDIYLEGQSALYEQNNEFFQAKNIEFFFKKYHLYGTASSVSKTDRIITFTDLKTTQCPPQHQSWSVRMDSMTYDEETDSLVIAHPGLFIHDYQIWHMNEFSFQGVRAKHHLENIPKLHIETHSGVSLQLPIVWTKENESIALIPEVNTKQGLGIGAVILKNNVYAKGFFQFMSRDQHVDDLSWMVSAASQNTFYKGSYGYQMALVSDSNFGYRYPGAIDFWENLYLVNYGWVAKETEVGKFTLSTEKLYRSQEARDPQYEVIEYLGRADWSKRDDVQLNAGADIIYRHHDQAYHRIRWAADYDLGSYRGFSSRLSAYPLEGIYTGAFLWAGKTNIYVTKIGMFECALTGSLANKEAAPLLLDTIAQPISSDFLQNAQWHSGLDWNSQGVWVTPQWTVDFAQDFQSVLSIAYALDRPTQPWESAQQPYLTPFRDVDRFSPVSLRLLGRRWSGEMLYDVLRGECVTAQWGRSIDFPQSVVDLRVFYHKYYPMDRLSQSVQSVAQCQYQYQLKTAGPWNVEWGTTWDCIPIQLSVASFAVAYDECCWKSHIKASTSRQYDPDTQATQWHYKVGIGLEIYALGMLDPKINPWAFGDSSVKRFLTKNNY